MGCCGGFIGEVFNPIVETVEDVGSSVVDAVKDLGSSVDDFVNETIPGGWTIPVIIVASELALAAEAAGVAEAAAAAEGVTAAEAAAAADAAAAASAGAGAGAGAGAAGAGLAEGAFPGLVEGTVAADAGIGAIAAPVTTGVVAETALPPLTGAETSGGIEALTPELNVGTAAPPAPGGIEALTPEINVGTGAPPAPGGIEALTPEVNVGTGAPPVSEGITSLPTEPVSGMDLAADAVPGNTITDAGAVVGTPVAPTEPVSGMDLAADATPGNTIADAGAVASTPPQGLTTDANQTAAETNRLLEQQANAAGTPVGGTPGWLGGLSDATGIPVGVLNNLAIGLGIKALAPGEMGTITNAHGTYTGPLANFQYNPATYTPSTYKPFAGGGSVETMSNANALGANTGYPMADLQRTSYSVPYQQPISQNVVTGSSASRVDPYTGEQLLASGGISNLGGYSDGGRLLRGPGDGVSDSIPAMIGNKQPARLADGEFVIPARIVSEIGNGSTDAGARKLYEMMDRVQAARRKTVGKNKFAANTKADKYLPT